MWNQTENFAPKSSENEDHVDSFLRLSWCLLFTIPSIRRNRQQRSLFECYASFAWSYSQKEARIVGKQFMVQFSLFAIMHLLTLRSFFVTFPPKIRCISFHNPHFHPVKQRLTSGEEVILKRWRGKFELRKFYKYTRRNNFKKVSPLKSIL